MSAPTDLSKLGRVNPGDNIRGVARADRIMGLQNITKAHVDGEPYRQSSNIDRIIGPGWVIHRRRRIRTFPGGGTALRTPFQIISRTRPITGELQLGVIQDSHLFNSEDRDTYEEPNDAWGLLTADEDQDQGWITVTTSDIGKKLWLEIELQEEDQVILNIDLRYDFPGTFDAWSGFPDPVEIDTEADPPAQLFWHQIIGEISNPDIDPREGSMILTIPDSGGTRIQVNQLLFDNIFMTTGRTTHDADQPDLPLLVNSSPYEPATDTGGTGTPIPPEADLMTPWQFGTVEAENHYDFEMVNASDEFGAKVLIYDGVVYTADNDAADPAGMPSDNSFIIDVSDGDEVWVGFTYENDLNYEVTSCWIDRGPSTPDDDPGSNTAYVTIGHVEVIINEPDSINVVFPINEICGDIFWQPPRSTLLTNFDFKLEDASEGFDPLVLIRDGVVIGPNDDPIDPVGMPSGNSYIIGVNDGDEIWVGVQWDLETDDGVSGDNIVENGVWIDRGPRTPDDAYLTQYITLGSVDVNFQDDFVQVFPTNETCGDIIIQYPPYLDSDELLQLSVDKDTGNVVWKTSKISQVTTEDASGYTGGGTDFLDDIDVLTFDETFDIYDGGGGQAVVKLADESRGLIDVQGSDFSYVPSVDLLTFEINPDPSAGYITVYHGAGETEAIIQVPLIPQSVGGFRVLVDDDGATYWGGTSACQQ